MSQPQSHIPIETPPPIESLSDLVLASSSPSSRSGTARAGTASATTTTSQRPTTSFSSAAASLRSGTSTPTAFPKYGATTSSVHPAAQADAEEEEGEEEEEPRHQPHRHPDRWNGWHLWRAESSDARAMREAQQAALSREGSSSHSSPSQPGYDARPQRQGFFTRAANWTRRRVVSGFSEAAATVAPTRRGEASTLGDQTEEDEPSEGAAAGQRGEMLSTTKLMVLTAAVAGAQISWSLELAYGTPYLLSLGLSKSATSLVWLAGPLSGLIAQPLIGSLSDRSRSSYRRRSYMAASALFLTASTLLVAFSGPIASILVDLTGGGLGDWDPERVTLVQRVDRWLAIGAFWALDLALNALQASSRALILDTAPAAQQSAANAWQGRMTAAGNVIGYAAGWLDLGSAKGLKWLGGGQFRKLAIVALVGMLLGVSTTCVGITEKDTSVVMGAATPSLSLWKELKTSTKDVYQAARRLPRPVRRVCAVQFFAFMAWFPYLFYASSFVAEIHAAEKHGGVRILQSESDKDTERGSAALLMFALVALVAGTILPYFALASDRRAHKPPAHASSLHASSVSSYTTEAHVPAALTRWARVKRAITGGLTLRSIWTLACLLLAVLLECTFLPLKAKGATVLVALVGVPWAVACWVPFALVMEQVHEAEQGSSPFEFAGDYHGARRTAARRRASLAAADRAALSASERSAARSQLQSALSDCAPLRPSLNRARHSSTRNVLLRTGTEASEAEDEALRLALEHNGGTGGTVLGIHNLAIVTPQFVVALIAALIFRASDAKPQIASFVQLVMPASQHAPLLGVLVQALSLSHEEEAPAYAERTRGVAWVLRFGGAMALVAALLTRFVPLTRTERQRRGEESYGVNEAVGDEYDEDEYSDEASDL